MGTVDRTSGLLNDTARLASGVGIHVQNLLYRFGLQCGRFTKYRLYCSRNVVKPDRAVEKCRDCDLIGGVERDGFGSSRFDCFVSQT